MEKFAEEVTFKLEMERVEPPNTWRNSVAGRGNSKCKGPEAGMCLVQRIAGSWGAWMAPLAGRPTHDFGPGHGCVVSGFEPRVGLYADSVEPAWGSLSLPLPCSHPPVCSRSLPLSQKEKK